MKKDLLCLFFLLSSALVNAQSHGYFKEDFEEQAFPPSGWSTLNLKGTNVWLHSNTLAHSGTKSAFSDFNLGKSINYLITKQFTVATGDSVTFWFTPQYVGYDDSLIVQVSTTKTNASNFSNTIGVLYDSYNYPETPGEWKRVSLDLSPFAGQNIYVAFKHVDNNGDGIYIDDVALGTPPAQDIAALSLDVPASLIIGSTITPKATFQNIGSKAQTFSVTLNAGSYTSTKTITSLPPLSAQQVSFDDYVVPSGTSVTFTAYSSLAGDAHPKNDTVTAQIATYTAFTNYGWIISKDIPAGVFANAVTTYNSGTAPNDTAMIFSIGGSTDSKIIGTTYRFNIKTNQWKKMTNMPSPRYAGSAFTYKGKIFYLGGYDAPFSPTDEVSVYDIVTGTWSDATSMPVALGDYAACQYADSLFYVIGGFNGTADVNTVYLYNASADKWTKCTNFTGVASDGSRAGVVNNTIVTVGGYSQNQSKLLAKSFTGVIDPAHPSHITWAQIADYPAGPTSRLGATGLKNPKEALVYFTGGFDNNSDSIGKKATWAYNINSQLWQLGPDKPTGVSNLSGFAPFVIHDSLYIASVGGYDGVNISTANEWLKIGSVYDVLPVHLVNFTASLQNSKTILNWKVAEDGSGGYYIIQRAGDGVHFADMSSKVYAGLASATKNYTNYDLLPLRGYNYYRIKIINNDGSISYSQIRSINNTALNAAVCAANVYPNPAHGPVNIMLQNSSGADEIVGIAITDAAGRKIINDEKTVGASLTVIYKLKPGAYVVNMLSKDGSWKQSEKVIVE